MPSTAHPVVTSDDYSSVTGILSWFIGAATVLCVASKLVTKWVLVGSLGKDDATICISTVFSIGMVASVLVQTSNGLGKPQDSLSPAELEKWEKAAYAADLTFIATLFFSKGTVFTLLQLMLLKHIDRVATNATAALIGLWAFSGLLVAAFQCKAPSTWEVLSRKCISQYPFWLSFGIINIAIEMALILLPIIMISHIRLPMSKKVLLGSMFAARILVVGSIIAELYYRHAASGSANRTIAQWPVTTCTLFVQSLSIITACLPYLKPFFSSLESGMILANESRARQTNTSSKLSDKRDPSTGVVSSQTMIMTDDHELTDLDNPRMPWANPTQMSTTVAGHSTDNDSIQSTSRIIRATTTFQMHSDGSRDI